MGSTDTSESPWMGIEAANVYNDIYYIPTYRPAVWALAGILLFLLPPLGAAILGWVVVGSLHRGDESLDMKLKP